MARSPDDPHYDDATPFGRKVYDAAESGANYDRDWLRSELERDQQQGAAAAAPTFEDQYEELFGKKLNFDPAHADETPDPRLDLTNNTGDDGFGGKLNEIYHSLSKPSAPAEEPNFTGEDTLRSIGSGAAQAGEAVAGGLEYAARNTDNIGGVMDDVTSGLSDLRRYFGKTSQSLLEGLSPETREGMQRHFASLDPTNSIWRGSPGQVIDRLATQIEQSLPSTVLTLIPAAIAFRAGMGPQAITWLGASEGGLSLGGIASNIADEVEGLTPEQLSKESPRYREMLANGADPEQARQQLITEAQGMAPLIGGVAVGAISAVTGRFLEPVFEKGAGLIARTATGFGEEALQEGPQSAAEQMAQNWAAQTYDQHRSIMQGVGEQALQGSVVGGLSGAGFSATMGGGHVEAAPNEQPEQDATREQQPRAESFEKVFGQGGPERFDQAFPEPPVDKKYTPSGVEFVQTVPDELRAAITDAGAYELEEGGQQNMYLPQPGDLEAQGQQMGLEGMQQGAYREPVVNTPNALAQPTGQQNLPLQRRVRGGTEPVAPQPLNATDYSPDMSTPKGVNPDPRQVDAFNTPQVPDQPSAEPLQDIMAQLDEMDRPEATEREAVYLSAANIEQLRNSRELDPILERGVPLANFDGKGGLLIARDRQVADSLVQLRNEGGDLQEILGTATGAGVGKPLGAGLVVQRRQNGAVVQESIVQDEAAADALSQEWETKYPNDEVGVLTAQAVLGRRNRLLQQEQQKRVTKALGESTQRDKESTSQQVRQATAITPDEGPSALLSSRGTARRVTEGATSPTKAAARLLGQATRESAKPEQRRIGGYYPTEALDFADKTEETRYNNRFKELTDRELELEFANEQIDAIYNRKFSERAREGRADRKERYKAFKEKQASDAAPLTRQREVAQARKDKLLDELQEIRTRAKPVRRAVHLVAAARRLSPEAVKQTVRIAPREDESTDDETEVGASIGRAEGAPDTAQLSNEELAAMKDTDIERLTGDQLDDTFKRAATYLAGRVQENHELFVGGALDDEAIASVANAVNRYVSGFWNPNSGSTEGLRGPKARGLKPVTTAGEYIPPGKTAPPPRRKVRALDAFKLMEKRYRSDSLKRKLVARARDLLASRAHGGATQSKPITARSAQMKTRSDVHRRTGKFNTQVLAAEFTPQDESAQDKLKRQALAKRTRARLEKTIQRGRGHIEKLSSGKYQDIATERDGEELSERARSMIHGRAYFRMLLEFGNAMVKSGNTGTEITHEMDKLDEFVRNAVAMPANDFARVMGNLLHAEAQTQIAEAKTEEIKKLADPEVREQKNADILAELMAAEAHLLRLNMHRQNPYYTTIVEPLVHKISNSTARDGYPSYKPTEQEMLKLQWVMNNWKIPRMRKEWYTPIRRYFSLVGFEWTPTKKVKGEYVGGELIIPYVESTNKGDRGRVVLGDGKAIRYKYSLPDRALRPLYVAKFGPSKDDSMGANLHGPVAYTKPHETLPPPSKRLETLGKLLQANRVITKFRDLIKKPKMTVAGMIRTEERLIRAFKELGMWTQSSPLMGTVQFQDQRQSYRLVGPRLASKELSKEEGRKLLLQQIKRRPVTDDAYVNYESVQRRANTPLNAETEMFLERVADPGASIEQFRETAVKIGALLDDANHVHTLGDMFEVLERGLPQNHMFANLVTKLRESGIGETPVSWDYRNQLDDSQMGAAKWDDDSRMPGGRFRYVLLHRANVYNPAKREHGARLLHVLLHEAVHIATSGALDRHQQVRQAFTTLKLLAARFLHNDGGIEWEKLPYGLKEEHDIGEFVAEAFSNPRFQQMLKRIRFDYSKSLWERFTDLVKNILGIAGDRPEPQNAFEAVMTLQNHIFTGQDRVFGGVSTVNRASSLSMLDDTTRPVAEDVLDSIKESGTVFKRMWARAKSPNAPLVAMSMRQLHKEFRRHFGVGKNSYDRYMENWEFRNAENSKLMEQGEAVSRDWSAAAEKTSEAHALEFSRIATEATLGGLHPDRPATAAGNEHLQTAEARARHAELAARFNKLPAEWKALYTRLQNYYTRTLNQETNLLMLNALRGTLASGDNAIMSRADFDKKYTEETVRDKKLYTQEGLEREFGTLDRSMVNTLKEIASIPTKREGPYFPLTRYGNYVVYAKKLLERKQFTTSKEAYAYRAQKLAADPTIDVGVKKNADDDYTVFVHDIDFRTRETATEAEQQKQDMINKYGREAVTDVQLKDNFQPDEAIQSGSALAGILSNLKGNVAAQNAIKNYWLRTLADRSFRKHQIRRKNRQGVDFDLQHRSFTNYVKQASYHISQLKYGWRMADAAGEIRKFVKDSRDTSGITSVRLGQVSQELQKRDAMVNNMTELPKAFRTATELGQLFMLFGPSYWAINLTQPYMVTMPWLSARYGLGGSAAAMKNAQSMILHPILKASKNSIGGLKAYFSKVAAEKAFNVLDQVKATIKQRGGDRASAYIDMLEQLRQQSVIDLSWIAELRDISEGQSTSRYQRFMDATRVMAHLTEVNNRIVTALAAYDLRYNEVMAREGATHALAHGAAIQTAKDAVAETQFDYSSANKPRLFQTGGPAGKFAPMVFQFMQYSQHMYAMLVSNFAALVNEGTIDRATAAKTLAGILTTHMLAAGVLGSIAIQPIKWAVGLFLLAFGDDDKPWTVANAASGEAFDRWAREGLSWALGNKLGAVVAQGVPELAGVRLTDRMSLGTVYFLDLKTDTAESTIGSVAQGFLGPVLGYGASAIRAGQFMLEGEFERAAETLAPKAIRDVMRTIRFAGDGVVNNAGDTVIQAKDLSAWQLFMQSMGFRPSEVADFYAKQSVVKETEQLAKDHRDRLISRFRKSGSIDERNAVLKEAAEFSQRNPAMAITRSSLLRALAGKAEREAGYEASGVALRGRSRLYADVGDYYDTEEE